MTLFRKSLARAYRLQCWAGIVFAVLAAVPICSAWPADSPESRLKVAFLYNFTKFATWLEPGFSAQSTISVCVLGKDAVSADLETIKTKTAQGRPLSLAVLSAVNQAKNCNVLFIGQSEKNKVSDILKTLGDSNVLTVSDIGGFATAGGIIELVNEDGRITFDVNLDCARRVGLKLHAQLLKVARVVHNSKENR